MNDVVRLPRLLSEHEAAAALRVHVCTLRRMRSRGEIRAKKIGGRWRYTERWLAQFIEGAHGALATDQTPTWRNQRILA